MKNLIHIIMSALRVNSPLSQEAQKLEIDPLPIEN